MHVVGELKQSVAGLLTGTNLDNVTNLDLAISRAARYVAQRTNAPEATGREVITLYDGVYYYNAPENLFGTSVVIIRPQGNVNLPGNYDYKVPIDVFTRGKFNLPNGYLLDLEYDQGDGIIGISTSYPIPKLILSTMDDSSDWTPTGSAGTITTDTVNFYYPPASLRFTCTGASTGILTSTITSTDMSDFAGVGVAFLAIETPSASALTSINVRIGSSSTNYYTVNETTGFLGAWKANQWLLVAFDLSAATTTGSPNASAITYLQVLINHSSTLTNMRLGGLFVSQPSLNEIIYQTAALFKTATGLSNTITSDSDEIILNDAAYSILELETAKTVALQMSGGIYTDQIRGFDQILNDSGSEVGLYGRYRADNPGSILRSVDSYYDFNPGYGPGW